MQIKVEIDVKPEELRRFLGLPDVAGLQDDIMGFLHDKMGQVSDNLSPAAEFLRGNLENLKGSAAVQRLLNSVKVRVSEADVPAEPAGKQRARAKTAANAKPRKRAAKKSG